MSRLQEKEVGLVRPLSGQGFEGKPLGRTSPCLHPRLHQDFFDLLERFDDPLLRPVESHQVKLE
jgi:hypothetical protein